MPSTKRHQHQPANARRQPWQCHTAVAAFAFVVAMAGSPPSVAGQVAAAFQVSVRLVRPGTNIGCTLSSLPPAIACGSNDGPAGGGPFPVNNSRPPASSAPDAELATVLPLRRGEADGDREQFTFADYTSRRVKHGGIEYVELTVTW